MYLGDRNDAEHGKPVCELTVLRRLHLTQGPVQPFGKSAGLVIERLRVRVPTGAAGEFSPPELIFCADSLFGARSTSSYRRGK